MPTLPRCLGSFLGLAVQLLLGGLVVATANSAAALPLGTIGATADSLIRVEGGSHCGAGGTMCVEAIGNLPPGQYATDGVAQINAQGSVDHAAGTLSGLVTFSHGPDASSDGQLYVHARDQFTVTGTVPGELISITARLQADGTITITPEPANAFVEAQLSANQGSGWNATNGGIGITTGTVDGFNQGQSLLQPGAYPYDIESVSTFDVVTGTPFQLVYALRLNGSTVDAFPAGDPGNVALDSLASLLFDLPSGYSITSELGYSVPEPGPMVLVGLGLAVLLGATCIGRARTPVARERA